MIEASGDRFKEVTARQKEILREKYTLSTVNRIGVPPHSRGVENFLKPVEACLPLSADLALSLKVMKALEAVCVKPNSDIISYGMYRFISDTKDPEKIHKMARLILILAGKDWLGRRDYFSGVHRGGKDREMHASMIISRLENLANKGFGDK